MLPWQAEQQIFAPTRIALCTPSSPARSACAFSPIQPPPICLLSLILLSVFGPVSCFLGCQRSEAAAGRGRSVGRTEAPFTRFLMESQGPAKKANRPTPLWPFPRAGTNPGAPPQPSDTPSLKSSISEAVTRRTRRNCSVLSRVGRKKSNAVI